jgi:hypothetical protein
MKIAGYSPVGYLRGLQPPWLGVGMRRRVPLGSEAKPLPAAKADLGLLFDFQHVEKSSMYLSGYTSGFSPH